MPTKDVAPPGRTYSAHRERQRRRILEAVQKLFDQRGIDRVTMAEIISSTGLRASTIYQYFSNKDDIVRAMLGEVMADSAARAKEGHRNRQNGADQKHGAAGTHGRGPCQCRLDR
jgi:AcrR family transcriptional regulator